MDDMRVSGGAYTWGVEDTAAAKTDKIRPGQTADTIAVIGGKTIALYSNASDAPALVAPNPNASEEAEVFTPAYDISAAREHLGTLDSVFDGLAEKYNLSQEQQEKLVSAYLLDQIPDDTFLADLKNELETKVAEEMSAEFEVGEWNPKGIKNRYEKQVSLRYNESVEKLLDGNNLEEVAKALGMSVEELKGKIGQLKNKLRGAHYFPDEPADAEVKMILGAVQKAAVESMQANGILVPDNWRPESVDQAKFKAEIDLSYDSAFEEALGKFEGLSQEEAAQIKYLHYHPDAQFPNGDKLKGILSKVESEALKHVQGQYAGVPAGMINPATATFDMQIHSEYSILFEQNLQTFQPPLTQAQIDDIKFAIGNPGSSKVSEQTKVLVDKIKNQTIDQIKQKHSLPVNWKPIGEISLMGPGVRVVHNAIQYLSDTLSELTLYTNGMANGPEKTSMLNTLKVISEAIAEFQQLLYLLQAIDSEIGKEMSQREFEITMKKLEKEGKTVEEMQKKAEEAYDKRKKAEQGALAMKILGPILAVIALVLAVLPPGIGTAVSAVIMAFLIADGIYSSASGKPSLVRQGFEKLNEALVKVFGEEFGSVLQAIIAIVVAIMVVAVSGNVAVALSIFAASGIITDLAKNGGADDETAAIIDAAVTAALAIAGGAMAASTKITTAVQNFSKKLLKGILDSAKSSSKRIVAEAAKAAGKETAKAAAKETAKAAAKETAKAAAKETTKAAAKEGGDAAAKGFRYGNLSIQAVASVSEVTVAGIQMDAALTQAQVELMQGQLDEFLETIQALIDSLEKVKSQILDGAGDIAEFIGEITEDRDATWGQQSQLASNIIRS